MPNLEAKTVIAEAECSACGKPVKVKVNKTGKAYYYCFWTLPDGEPCNHHQKWGGAHSQIMQQNFIAARKSAKETPNEPTKTPDIQEQQSTGTDAGADRDKTDGWDVYSQFAR